jgi:hypothetical protein
LLSQNIKIKIHRTIILLVVVYGCEIWLLTLREEDMLKVSEHRVLRRIFGPMQYEVKGEWRKLHNEEFNDLNSSSNIVCVIKSRRMRWAGHVANMGARRGYTVFWRGKRTERDHLRDRGVDEATVLIWILKI